MWTASWEYFSQETVSKAETQSPRNLVREAEPLQAPENLWTEGWKWITEKVEYISQEAVVPKAKTGPPRTTVREPQPDSESSSRAQYQDAGSVARNVYGTVRNTVGHYVPGAVSAAVTDGEQEKNTDAEKSWKLDLLLWWIGYDPNAPHPLVRIRPRTVSRRWAHDESGRILPRPPRVATRGAAIMSAAAPPLPAHVEPDAYLPQ